MKLQDAGWMIAGIAIACVANFLIGYHRGQASARWEVEQMERRLIERGYAEWVVVDAVSGRTELKIKECIK